MQSVNGDARSNDENKSSETAPASVTININLETQLPPAPNSSTPEPHLYSSQEISHHNTVDDTWIVIHGNVYNITTFQHEHPGGQKGEHPPIHTLLAATLLSSLGLQGSVGRFFWVFFFFLKTGGNRIDQPPVLRAAGSSNAVFAAVSGKDATKKFDKYHRRGILEQVKHRKLQVGVVGVPQGGDNLSSSGQTGEAKGARGWFRGKFDKLLH